MFSLNAVIFKTERGEETTFAAKPVCWRRWWGGGWGLVEIRRLAVRINTQRASGGFDVGGK